MTTNFKETAEQLSDNLAIEALTIPLFAEFSPKIYLVRLDAIRCGTNDRIMGNKIFKLLPSIQRAKENNINRIISFGGPWSNHIHALAAAGDACHLQTVGIIRGERKTTLTPTLQDAQQLGMRLQFVSRSDYQQLQMPSMSATINQQFGDGMIVPVGGSNLDGLLGTTEMGKAIVRHLPKDVSDIWLASATGGTAAGMIAGADAGINNLSNNAYNGNVTAVSVLRHCEMAHDIDGLLQQILLSQAEKIREKGTVSQPWRVLNGYDCGGYARVNKDLLAFHQQLEKQMQEPVDQVYMAKLLFALWTQLREGKLNSHSAIAVIHSGGQQGRRGLVPSI
ncbi:MAG: pyridoxal-phosphate dependent enzyme [Cellvibrionales bacterium]|nr:pyridoxal-phosphate dependent enzyme [Cellvibrionales bacterium]